MRMARSTSSSMARFTIIKNCAEGWNPAVTNTAHGPIQSQSSTSMKKKERLVSLTFVGCLRLLSGIANASDSSARVTVWVSSLFTIPFAVDAFFLVLRSNPYCRLGTLPGKSIGRFCRNFSPSGMSPELRRCSKEYISSFRVTG